MFELAPSNGGISGSFAYVGWPWDFGGMQSVGTTWEWSPTWSEIMGIPGFDPSAAN